MKYIIIHNKHEGCYDFQFYEDEASRMRLTSITINPPKIFMFSNKEQAFEFFNENINDEINSIILNFPPSDRFGL
jgi:hypothetical protein